MLAADPSRRRWCPDQLSQGAARLPHAPWRSFPAVVEAGGSDPGDSAPVASGQWSRLPERKVTQ